MMIRMDADRDSLRGRVRAFNFAPDRPAPGFEVRAAADGAAEILLYDEIGWFGVTAKAFVEQLAAIDAKRINLRINSPGGDVFDGMAMFQALLRHPAAITASVDGLAASAASVVMLAAGTVEIAETGMVMVHKPWGIGLGDDEEIEALAKLLRQMNGQIAGVYMARTGNDTDTVEKWMAAETWFTGAEAVEAGFAQTLLETPKREAKALTRWDLRAYRNAPAAAPDPQNPDAPPPVGRQHLGSLKRDRERELAKLHG